jgi:hypothetical protein
MGWTPSGFSVDSITPDEAAVDSQCDFFIQGKEIPPTVAVLYQSGDYKQRANDIEVSYGTQISGNVTLQRQGTYQVIVYPKEGGPQDGAYLSGFKVK